MLANQINDYQGTDILYRDKHNLILSPHDALRPYIANYTFSNPIKMPSGQTILPSASTTLVYSIKNNRINSGLRGVSTKSTRIDRYATQFDALFLIEFHAGGLFPFTSIPQHILKDENYAFDSLNTVLDRKIIEAYTSALSITALKKEMDTLFLRQIGSYTDNQYVRYSLTKIIEQKGGVRVSDLAKDTCYSDKQLNRLFQQYIGTGVKTFSRIVRMKHAIELLPAANNLSSLIEQTDHYDSAHFVHDFRKLYGITPSQYLANMSLFYNDRFKLDSYT
ncbi:AraC family transcriptional regulator [Vagococcus sp. BWB3-3]|uniref:AraC family transcriptional regulator n=1 Tax=Vagococcus allomyrinae TaxID=2794353 RepID=A0A940PDE2_9ENTE|nr:helix-turn-helix domain-containing protein [Vagococcus allomyrinae]MBP1041898.1 AraC family transcriptional regulator [Vagococcus allomyrinae]